MVDVSFFSMVKGIIFDYNRTLFDPVNKSLIPGAKEVLDNLSQNGFKIALMSRTSDKTKRMEQIHRIGIMDNFSHIQLIQKDTEDKGFHHLKACADKMSLPASELAVVGDRVRSEIRLGKKLDMLTIWYKAGKYSDEMPMAEDEAPHHTITQLGEVIRIVRD
ncbi:HAD hydrolase-like protein [Candidatus Woesearchaeota archaeon]|nr:HAD hydrolase-like protein [Candidatus Woesearchaeota archaeon]